MPVASAGEPERLRVGCGGLKLLDRDPGDRGGLGEGVLRPHPLLDHEGVLELVRRIEQGVERRLRAHLLGHQVGARVEDRGGVGFGQHLGERLRAGHDVLGDQVVGDRCAGVALVDHEHDLTGAGALEVLGRLEPVDQRADRALQEEECAHAERDHDDESDQASPRPATPGTLGFVRIRRHRTALAPRRGQRVELGALRRHRRHRRGRGIRRCDRGRMPLFGLDRRSTPLLGFPGLAARHRPAGVDTCTRTCDDACGCTGDRCLLRRRGGLIADRSRLVTGEQGVPVGRRRVGVVALWGSWVTGGIALHRCRRSAREGSPRRAQRRWRVAE